MQHAWTWWAKLLVVFGLLSLIGSAGIGRAQAATRIQLEAENDRAGGEGGGYHDTTRGNGGGATAGWQSRGEWLADDLFSAAGTYTVRAAASARSGNQLHLTSHGAMTAPVTFAPPAGPQSLPVVATGRHVDRNGQTFQRLDGSQPPTGSAMLNRVSRPTSASGEPLLPPPTQPSNAGPWFQVVCTPGRLLPDDPIVVPGRPGASHRHQFFGAHAVDATATLATLQRSGTTCSDQGDTAAYWVPALYDTHGAVHTPRRVRAYYYANAADATALQAFPSDLRIIAGRASATGPQPAGVIEWLCRDRQSQAAGRPLASTSPPTCRHDQYLSLSVRFPDCWDGGQRDTPDHQRHMAYADARGHCPTSHPVKVPKLRLSLTYEDLGFSGGAFTLGGPRGDPMALPWYAMHADFWNGWDPAALATYVNGCLKRARSVRSTSCQR